QPPSERAPARDRGYKRGGGGSGRRANGDRAASALSAAATGSFCGIGCSSTRMATEPQHFRMQTPAVRGRHGALPGHPTARAPALISSCIVFSIFAKPATGAKASAMAISATKTCRTARIERNPPREGLAALPPFVKSASRRGRDDPRHKGQVPLTWLTEPL